MNLEFFQFYDRSKDNIDLQNVGVCTFHENKFSYWTLIFLFLWYKADLKALEKLGQI